jgi:hypothetical protein
MAEPKPLTYDERKAAEAAFIGAPSDPNWTDAAHLLYARLSATLRARSEETTGMPVGPAMRSGKTSDR